MSTTKPRILVFDSGSGGLSVAQAIRQQLPDANMIYAADTAAFPYGRWAEVMLVKRILRVMRELVSAVEPDCIVIGCNTASTLALEVLREEFRIPFVGTVPAIKPAAAQTQTGVIGVLATPGTVRREYTKTLIHTYAFHCKVLLHGASEMAEIAERKLAGERVDLKQLLAEIKPVFKTKGGQKTDTVVLGCTHYPLLLDELREIAPWPVNWIDPAPAIARRTQSILPDAMGRTGSPAEIVADTVILTAALAGEQKLPAGYVSHGFKALKIVEIPV